MSALSRWIFRWFVIGCAALFLVAFLLQDVTDWRDKLGLSLMFFAAGIVTGRNVKPIATSGEDESDDDSDDDDALRQGVNA